MPCYDPRHVYSHPTDKTVNGKKLIIWDPGASAPSLIPLKLPCGQCVGCRLERSRQWAIRVMHEAQLSSENCFITLTYDDEHLPELNSLHHPDFQLFMKRLRERVRSKNRKIRYYMCGEYGETFGRPHFHACIFNFDFPDKQFLTKIRGNTLYTSKLLQELWPQGYSSIGSLTFESAAYVARYIMKKQSGDSTYVGSAAFDHYAVLDEYGEYQPRRAEYTKMSLKPGIAKNWFEKFSSDVFPSDSVVVRGKEMKPPKYYDKLYEIGYPSDFDDIKLKRYQSAMTNSSNNTPERLAVREQVQLAKLDKLKRTLK